jgi:hypothetical protein
VDGVLTDEALWPWPMADRIEKELGIDIMQELEDLFGPIPRSCFSSVGDLNADGEVNALDLQSMINMITGGFPVDLLADLDGDGEVDGSDLVIMVELILGP